MLILLHYFIQPFLNRHPECRANVKNGKHFNNLAANFDATILDKFALLPLAQSGKYEFQTN
jgi:hypothetical protein